MKETNKSYIHEEMKSRLELGNAYYHSVQNNASGNYKRENIWAQEPRQSRVVYSALWFPLAKRKWNKTTENVTQRKKKTFHQQDYLTMPY
jgi:hypothetical protein